MNSPTRISILSPDTELDRLRGSVWLSLHRLGHMTPGTVAADPIATLARLRAVEATLARALGTWTPAQAEPPSEARSAPLRAIPNLLEKDD